MACYGQSLFIKSTRSHKVHGGRSRLSGLCGLVDALTSSKPQKRLLLRAEDSFPRQPTRAAVFTSNRFSRALPQAALSVCLRQSVPLANYCSHFMTHGRLRKSRIEKGTAHHLALALIFFSASLLRAQTGPSDQPPQDASLTQLSLEQLGNIEVTTAGKVPEQLWKTAAAIYVITQEDIRRSGVTSIPEALRLAPGVEVGRISADTWAIGIRGLQSNFSKSVLVLIDGRSVYTTLFAGVYWDVQDLPLEDIERIEVIRGPGGTIWGPNAVNGVINIITKNSADTHGAM